MYRHYTAVRSVLRKLRAIEGFSHKGESVKGGSTVYVHCWLLAGRATRITVVA